MTHNIKVIIKKAAKNPMQSGLKKNSWQISFPADFSKYNFPLMNWTGSYDTNGELNLQFPTQEQAINLAKNNGWEYEVKEERKRKIISKSYADNFPS